MALHPAVTRARKHGGFDPHSPHRRIRDAMGAYPAFTRAVAGSSPAGSTRARGSAVSGGLLSRAVSVRLRPRPHSGIG